MHWMDRFFFTLDVLFEDCVNALRAVLRVLTHTVTVPSCAVGIIRKSFFFQLGKFMWTTSQVWPKIQCINIKILSSYLLTFSFLLFFFFCLPSKWCAHMYSIIVQLLCTVIWSVDWSVFKPERQRAMQPTGITDKLFFFFFFSCVICAQRPRRRVLVVFSLGFVPICTTSTRSARPPCGRETRRIEGSSRARGRPCGGTQPYGR